jgi:hypothetical protein
MNASQPETSMNTFTSNQQVTTRYGQRGSVVVQQGVMVTVCIDGSYFEFHHTKLFAA